MISKKVEDLKTQVQDLKVQVRELKKRAEDLVLFATEYLWTRRKKIAFYTFLVVLIWKKDIGWEMSSPDLNYQAFAVNGKEAGQAEFALFSSEESAPIFINGKYAGDEWDDSEPNDRPPIWDSYRKPAAQKKKYKTSSKSTSAAQKGNNLANTFTNLTFIADDPNASKKDRAYAKKKLKQLAYVDRFAQTAQTEMEKYKIPASITLAQGLLESNVGESRLATQNNNHFGIKCFSKKCKKGHCANFTDDSHKDFFRKYKSTWESFRAHSKLLQAKRYRPLYKLDKMDYEAWAHGLKKAGYATDKKYAPKIIQLIKDLNLDKYDR